MSTSAVCLLPGAAWGAAPVATAAENGIPDRGRAIVLRPARVDVVLDGRVVGSARRAPGPYDLAMLDRIVSRPDWLRHLPNHDYRIAAAVVQKPGTSLVLANPVVRQVLLVSGTGARLVGSNAQLVVDGATIVAVEPNTMEPSLPSPGRGFVYYSGGGQVVVNRSALRSLGTPGSRTSGLTVGSGTGVSVTDSSIEGNTVGLAMSGASPPRLMRVHVSRSDGDGAVLRDVDDAVLESFTSSGNAGNGLLLSRAARSLVVNADLRENRKAGLRAENSDDLRVEDSSTALNGSAGASLASVRNAALNDQRTENEPVGVALTGDSRQVLLNRLIAEADGSGVVSDGTTQDLQVVDPLIRNMTGPALDLSGPRAVVTRGFVQTASAGLLLRGDASDSSVTGLTVYDVGIGLSAATQVRGVRIEDVTVQEASVGIRLGSSAVRLAHSRLSQVNTGLAVRGAADDVQVDALVVEDAALGVSVAKSTRRVVLRDMTLRQETGIAVGSSSPDLTVVGGSITGAQVGLDLHAAASVSGTTVSDVSGGVRVGRGAQVDLADVQVRSSAASLWVSQHGGMARVRSSGLFGLPATTGPVELRGRNDLTPGPLPWFGIAGMVTIVCALSLELLRRLRESEPERSFLMPQHILNRA